MALLRSEFPALGARTYLDSCAHGLLATRVRRAGEAWLDAWADEPDWGRFQRDLEAARRAFARLVHAPPEEVALHANASTAISTVMSALRPEPRPRLVASDVDFPTAPMILRRQETRGFRLTRLRTLPRAPTLSEWKQALAGGDVALVSLPLVASFTGERLDVAAVAELAHAEGALVMVDAFQAAGTMPIDPRRLGADFLVTGVYKWLLAPAGLAFLWTRRELLGRLEPAATGWLALDRPYEFDSDGPLASDARRLQQGGPSVLGCAMAAESLALVDELGLDRIEAHNQALGDRLLDGIAARGWEALTPRDPARRGSIVTFRGPPVEPALAALAAARVKVNPRLGGLRVSPHFYNDEADVDRLFEVLDAVK